MDKRGEFSTKTGFTLIELLIVMAIITTLATLIFVSLDPILRFQQARNSRRQTDLDSILTAIHEYIIDNNGTLPSGLSTTEQQLGTCTTGGNTFCTDSSVPTTCLDLSVALSKYLKSIPADPSSGTSVTTGYSVVVDSNNIVTVKACLAENGQTLTVSE